jgi:flagellar motility protein MotE (MotC chaperone)
MKRGKTHKPIKRSLYKKRSGRGALLILAIVFLMSAGARLISGTGAAIAREISQLAPSPDNTTSNNQGELCEPDSAMATLLESLRKREDIIVEQEMMIAQKMKTLDLARTEFTQNLASLQKAEKRLAATMAASSTAAQDDLDKLTAVYESMKPKDAAALFEQMSPDFAAGFLGLMRPDVAASVLAGLKPETAYTISVILAGRNANAPSE